MFAIEKRCKELPWVKFWARTIQRSRNESGKIFQNFFLFSQEEGMNLPRNDFGYGVF